MCRALAIGAVYCGRRDARHRISRPFVPAANTNRNGGRGLAHLARAGFCKVMHVKSLPAHAIRALIVARKKLVGSVSHSRTRSEGLQLCLASGCRAVLDVHC